MTFTIFYEKFLGGVSSPEGYSEIYLNPGWADRDEMVGTDKYASFRAVLAPNGDLYAWVDKGGVIHEDVAHKFGLSFKQGAIALYIYPEDKHNIIISYRAATLEAEKDSIIKRVQNNQNLQTFLDEPLHVRDSSE